uniref:Protein ORF44 n=1 Tax=Anguillid herpesvirus 1 TaxID=150286 RepID=A0A8E5EWN9_9VIRU|nr:protein ORF44 [Anguillid herpesvirus 1]
MSFNFAPTPYADRLLCPTFTDSAIVFAYEADGCYYGVAREHLGYMVDEQAGNLNAELHGLCKVLQLKDVPEVEEGYIQIELVNKIRGLIGIDMLLESDDDDDDDDCLKDVGVTLSQLIKWLKKNTAVVEAQAIKSTTTEQIMEANVEVRLAFWKAAWDKFVWPRVVSATRVWCQTRWPRALYPELWHMCVAFVTALEGSMMLTHESAVNVFSPLLVPVFFKRNALNSFYNAGLFDGYKVKAGQLDTGLLANQLSPAGNTNHKCDLETWMTVENTNHITALNPPKAFPVAAERTIFYFAQTAHHLGRLQVYIEAMLHGSNAGVSEEHFSCERSNVHKHVANVFSKSLKVFASRQFNCLWTAGVTFDYANPEDFSLPDGESPKDQQTPASWGQVTWRQSKNMDDTCWLTYIFKQELNPRLNEALAKLSVAAQTVCKKPVSDIFTGLKIGPDGIVTKAIQCVGTLTNSGKLEMSEAGNICVDRASSNQPNASDDWKPRDLSDLSAAKYRVAMKTSAPPNMLLERIMACKWIAIFLHTDLHSKCIKQMPGDDTLGQDHLFQPDTRLKEMAAMAQGLISTSPVENGFGMPLAPVDDKYRSSLAAELVFQPADKTPSSDEGFKSVSIKVVSAKCPMFKVFRSQPKWPVKSAAEAVNSFSWMADLRDDVLENDLQSDVKRANMKAQVMAAFGEADNKVVKYTRPHLLSIEGKEVPQQYLLSDRYTKAIVYPKINIDRCTTKSGSYHRALWFEEIVRGSGNDMARRPVAVLQSTRLMFKDSYFSNGGAQAAPVVEETAESDLIVSLVSDLGDMASVREEDLDNYDLSPQALTLVKTKLKEQGVDVIARQGLKRKAAPAEDSPEHYTPAKKSINSLILG